MWNGDFWKAVAERALRTFVQFLLVTYGATAVDVFTIDWRHAVGLALGGLILSVLMSLAAGFVGPGGPSLATERLVSTGRHALRDD